MKTHKLPVLSVVGLFLLGCTARAQEILSYYTQVPDSATNWEQTLQLPGFDASLGTLTQVQLIFTANMSQSVFAQNLGGTESVPYNLKSEAWVTAGKAGGPLLFGGVGSIAVLQQSGTLGAFDGTQGSGGASEVSLNKDSVINGQYVDPDLAGYVGVPSISFDASARAYSWLTIGGGNYADGAVTMTSEGLQVDYTYTPTAIPEPPAFASLLGATALGFVILRRRRIRGEWDGRSSNLAVFHPFVP